MCMECVYTDVKKRLLEKKAEIQQTIHPEAAVRGMTVEKWMRSWLETDFLGRIKASSYLTYLNQMNRHILPCLGRMQMASITPEMVHSFLECLQAKGLGGEHGEGHIPAAFCSDEGGAG